MSLHGLITQNNNSVILTAMRASYLFSVLPEYNAFIGCHQIILMLKSIVISHWILHLFISHYNKYRIFSFHHETEFRGSNELVVTGLSMCSTALNRCMKRGQNTNVNIWQLMATVS
jgi:hypothetical protein